MKNGESASDNLKNVHAENSKQTKSTNWNFIWYVFYNFQAFIRRSKNAIRQSHKVTYPERLKRPNILNCKTAL